MVQHRVSGDKLPRLGLSVPYFELFMTGWEGLRDSQVRLKPWLNIGLKWALKYYSRMDDTTAHVIAMRTLSYHIFKNTNLANFSTVVEPSIRMSWIEDHWGDDYIHTAKNTIFDMVRASVSMRTYTDYPNQMRQYHSRLPQEPFAESQPRLLEDFDAIAARLHIKDMGSRRNTRETGQGTVEDEYNSYVKGVLTKQGDNPLKFWDVRARSEL